MSVVAAPSPAFITQASGDAHVGESIGALSREVGRPLLPWQASVACGATEIREDGRWRWPLVTVTVPRQAGKTHLIGMVALDRAMTVPDARIYYSAQSRGDALMRWREFAALLRNTELVESRHRGSIGWSPGDYRVRNTIGDECITFNNGSEVRIFAPQEDSLHGSVTDLVILDEVRFFDLLKGTALMSAILPSQVTRNGQVWIVSTSGDGRAAFLANLVENGRACVSDPNAKQFHAEWAIPDNVPDADLLDAVREHHPAYGTLLHPDALELAFTQMSGADFAREYGNNWTDDVVAEETALPLALWEATATEDPLPEGVVTFGADVALDRSSAAIVACVSGVLEVIDVRAGAAWLPNRLRELHARWPDARFVLDQLGPTGPVADALAGELEEALLPVNTRAVVNACAEFYDALTSDPPTLAHRPNVHLDDAAAHAEQRRVGQSWAWSRKRSGGPVLVAATLALHGDRAVVTVPETPMIW